MLSFAYVLLNRYLDIKDAIEDRNPHHVDNSDFSETDIPPITTVPLPEALTSVDEEVKDWVLTASIEGNVEHELPTRTCEGCQGEAGGDWILHSFPLSKDVRC
jgi:hypothetical protein